MIPIESLCQDWKDGKELLLWAKAVSRVSVKDFLRSDPDTDKKKLASAIACAVEGLFSKACRILTSHGIAPNNDTMFKLLKSKHSYAIPPTSIPAIQLPPTFNIAATLQTFPKGTACGPSGLRVQHLLDALDSRLPISMESLLHQVVNILLAGNAPTTLSPYLAGGNLTSLLKSKGTGWDV